MTALLFVSFLGLLLLGVPVAVALGGSSLLYVLAEGATPPLVVLHRMAAGVDSFPLLAVPFFILAGELMNSGGISRRIIDMAQAIGPARFLAQNEALRARGDLRPGLRHARGPVLVACGADDVVCPPAIHRTLAESLPTARLEIVDGAVRITSDSSIAGHRRTRRRADTTR